MTLETSLVTREFAPALSEIDLRPEHVALAMGYEPSALPAQYAADLAALLEEIPPLFEARCGFAIRGEPRFDRREKSLRLGGVEFATGPIITTRLAKSEAVACFLATIGPGIERRSHAYLDAGEMVKGYILDTIGSELAERLCDRLERAVEEEVGPRGWKITNRYSPGYCDWPVAEQRKLFSLLPGGFCGIRLTESSLMLPIKSVSGIIGVGPAAAREAYQCSVCDMIDCIRRVEAPRGLTN